MKHFLSMLFLILFLSNGFSVPLVNLEKGQVFIFSTSKLKQSDGVYSQSSRNYWNSEDENYISYTTEIQIKDKLVDRYKVQVVIHAKSIYNRKKIANDKAWWTADVYHDYLVSSAQGTEQLEDRTWEFDLTFDGRVDNKKEIEQRKRYGNEIRTPHLDFNNIFFLAALNKDISEPFNFNGLTYEVVNHSDTTIQLAGYRNDTKRSKYLKRSCLIDLNTGFVKEDMTLGIDTLNSRISKQSNKETKIGFQTKNKFYKRTRLLKSYSQFMGSDLETKKSIMATVKIKGKVKGELSQDSITLSWIEDKVNVQKQHRLVKPLQPENTFAFDVKINGLTSVFLEYKEIVELLLSPGDDLEVQIDSKDQEYIITAEGVGANNVNFMLAKSNYERLNNLSLESSDVFGDDDSLILNLKPEKIKKDLFAIMKARDSFLNSYSEPLGPEVYLSEFWRTRISIFTLLQEYYQTLNKYKTKDGVLPYELKYKDFFDFDHLIHLDNDLMSFSSVYHKILDQYGYKKLSRELRLKTGVGANNWGGKDIRNRYFENYGMTNAAFSGISQHTKKYSIVKDALLDASWLTASSLYSRFKEEYPLSLKTKLLDKVYAKALDASPGSIAYDFELENLKGEKVKLSDFRGKVIYLQFWKPGCCHTDIAKFAKSADNVLKSKNAKLILVALDDDASKTRTILDSLGIEGIRLIAGMKNEAILKEKYFFKNNKQAILIDTKGKVIAKKAPFIRDLLYKDWIIEDILKSKDEDDNSSAYLFKIIIISLAVLLCLMLITFLVYRRSTKRKLKLANLNTKVHDLELTAIRAQMNPHFMYNCLNSIQNLIQKYQMEEAHSYISKFASMTRSVLKYSAKEEISLSEELNILSEYVSLEQLRVNFEYEVNVDNTVDTYSVFMPPLLLQPLVENAIVHGLTPKEGNKQLNLSVKRKDERICIVIVDNGIGREASSKMPKLTTGNGLRFSEERLNLLGDKYEEDYNLKVEDVLGEDQEVIGTSVTISFFSEN